MLLKEQIHFVDFQYFGQETYHYVQLGSNSGDWLMIPSFKLICPPGRENNSVRMTRGRRRRSRMMMNAWKGIHPNSHMTPVRADLPAGTEGNVTKLNQGSTRKTLNNNFSKEATHSIPVGQPASTRPGWFFNLRDLVVRVKCATKTVREEENSREIGLAQTAMSEYPL